MGSELGESDLKKKMSEKGVAWNNFPLWPEESIIVSWMRDFWGDGRLGKFWYGSPATLNPDAHGSQEPPRINYITTKCSGVCL